MRARMAIAYSRVSVELREVVLKDKPDEMLLASPKGTVPVLVEHGKVLEESLDIMCWALSQNDPDDIDLVGVDGYLDNELIVENDNVFKMHLDHYKYADRFPLPDEKNSELFYREKGEVFLNKLDILLNDNLYLTSDKLSVIDFAIFPFIRQFAYVEKAWFDHSPYKNLKRWLEALLVSELFDSIMPKLPQWHNGDEATTFPC